MPLSDTGDRSSGADGARELLGDLLSGLTGVLYRCRNDRNWTMIDLAEPVEELTGYTPDELIGDALIPFADLIHPADRERVWETVQAAIAAGQPYRLVYRIRTKSGETRWVSEQGRSRSADGDSEELLGYIQDVTKVLTRVAEHREEEIRDVRREARFLELLQDITAIVNEQLTLDAALEVALPRICEALDFPVGHAFIRTDGKEGPLVSSHWYDPDGRFEGFRLATESGTWSIDEGLPGRVARSRRSEWVLDVKGAADFFRLASGHDSPVRSGLAAPIVSGDRSLGVLELFADRELEPDHAVEQLLEQVGVQLGRVWERESAARAIERGEAQLRQLAENMDAVFWIAAIDGELLYVSPAAERVLAAEAPTHVDEFLARVHPDDRAAIVRSFRDPENLTREREFRMTRGDGETIWVRHRTFPIRDEDGTIIRIGGLSEDVTGRLQAVRALEEATRLMRQTFASLDEAVILIDTSGEGRGILDANPAAERIFGYALDELIGETTEKLHIDHEHFVRFHEEHLDTLLRDGRVHADYEMARKDGTTFAAEQTVSLLDPARGLEGGAVSVIRDVSERSELEARLREAQKMEAVGRLAGGVAHDFNNLLTVIRAHTDFMLLELPDDSPFVEEVEAIQDAAAGATRLTRQLLAFGREQMLLPRVVDLNEAVVRTVALLDRVLGEDIRIGQALSDGPLSVRVDPSQLEQVLMNLAVNARDAMPDGGTLTFRTLRTEPERRPEASEPLEVCLEVEDSGVGMDAETRAHIFEPFFTTKARRGTGLGLATAYGIIAQSDGVIDVESEPGEGTTFIIRFPLADAEAEPLDVSRGPGETGHHGGGTLLVIEDDDAVRRVVCRIMEREGATVIEAPDGEEGLRRIAERADSIDAVLTDLVLPGLSGRDVVDRVRRDHPGLRLMVMSGYDEDSPGRRGVDLPDDVAFLAKPFTPAQLREAVAALLSD